MDAKPILLYFAIILISYLNPLALMAQQDTLTIEYESHEQVEAILTDSVRKNLKKLSIEIYDNQNTWFSFGRIPGQSEAEANRPSFRIKHPVDSLPWLGGMPNLEFLSIEFLGLTTLPRGIEELHNLKELDIGFNCISIPDAMEQLKALTNLKELVVFGLEITRAEREELTQVIPELKIIYAQEHVMEFAERKRLEKEKEEVILTN